MSLLNNLLDAAQQKSTKMCKVFFFFFSGGGGGGMDLVLGLPASQTGGRYQVSQSDRLRAKFLEVAWRDSP